MQENPKITIAGKTYEVPPLVTKQLRVVVPAIMRLGPLAGDATKLTTPLYDDMIQILFWGAVWPNRTPRDNNMDVLLDVHIPFNELTTALAVIREQTGLFVNAPQEGATPGEVNQ